MSVHYAVRTRLEAEFLRVPTPTIDGKGVRLEVWESPAGRAVGVEFHKDTVGLWIKKQHLFQVQIPDGVERREKEPKGRVWIGVGNDRKGANSNLSGYAQFVGAKVSHLLMENAEHAMEIFDLISRRRAA